MGAHPPPPAPPPQPRPPAAQTPPHGPAGASSNAQVRQSWKGQVAAFSRSSFSSRARRQKLWSLPPGLDDEPTPMRAAHSPPCRPAGGSLQCSQLPTLAWSAVTLLDPCLASRAQPSVPQDQLQPEQAIRSSTSSSHACMGRHVAGPLSRQLVQGLLAGLQCSAVPAGQEALLDPSSWQAGPALVTGPSRFSVVKHCRQVELLKHPRPAGHHLQPV